MPKKSLTSKLKNLALGSLIATGISASAYADGPPVKKPDSTQKNFQRNYIHVDPNLKKIGAGVFYKEVFLTPDLELWLDKTFSTRGDEIIYSVPRPNKVLEEKFGENYDFVEDRTSIVRVNESVQDHVIHGSELTNPLISEGVYQINVQSSSESVNLFLDAIILDEDKIAKIPQPVPDTTRTFETIDYIAKMNLRRDSIARVEREKQKQLPEGQTKFPPLPRRNHDYPRPIITADDTKLGWKERELTPNTHEQFYEATNHKLEDLRYELGFVGGTDGDAFLGGGISHRVDVLSDETFLGLYANFLPVLRRHESNSKRELTLWERILIGSGTYKFRLDEILTKLQARDIFEIYGRASQDFGKGFGGFADLGVAGIRYKEEMIGNSEIWHERDEEPLGERKKISSGLRSHDYFKLKPFVQFGADKGISKHFRASLIIGYAKGGLDMNVGLRGGVTYRF